MKEKIIESSLNFIRQKYEQIKEMTETLDVDSDPLICINILEKRSAILSEIENEKILLENECSKWQSLCEKNQLLKTMRGEIQLLIAATHALDSMTQEKLSRRMDTVKSEISNLGKTSNAALSYARHSG